MSLLSEFKSFALKGNVMDMAVGVIIGGAFGKIVSSFVNDVLMPPIGMLLGKTDFTGLSVTMNPHAVAQGAEAVTWNYGAFIQTCVDFVILAACVFALVKLLSLAKKNEKPAPAPEPPAPTKEEVLLTEIRDLLKNRQ
ncbi:MAG: large-conductance mechanosensitive channel protein MscL [Alistipes putredinis]|nr:MAG: large-conductance mechanosensitive channel protein MscL [Alistipes putredinis]